MQVTRISSAGRYEASEHFDMACLRLQGREATDARSMWIGLSHLLPGGHTSMKASPQEKIYVVMSGHVTVVTATERAVLGPLDSCVVAPGEVRQLRNDTTLPATILLAMQETG